MFLKYLAEKQLHKSTISAMKRRNITKAKDLLELRLSPIFKSEIKFLKNMTSTIASPTKNEQKRKRY